MTARRILRGVSTVLIAAGLLMLVDAGLTVAWQEPVTALLAKLRQNQLGGDLDRLERAGPTPAERRAPGPPPPPPPRGAVLPPPPRPPPHAGGPPGRGPGPQEPP